MNKVKNLGNFIIKSTIFIFLTLFFWWISYKFTGFIVEKGLMEIFPHHLFILNVIFILILWLVLLPLSIILSRFILHKLTPFPWESLR